VSPQPVRAERMSMLRLPLFLALLLSLGGCSTLSSPITSLFEGESEGSSETATPQEGAQQAAGETTNMPDGGLEIAWGADVDQRRPLSPYSFASPDVAGELIVLAGQDSYAHIFDTRGNELRRVALVAASDSGATALSDKLVVLGDAQGILYGIDPQAGSIAWRWQMPTVMLGRPVPIADDMLVQTGDNSLYRVNRNGEKLWSFSSAQAGMSMNLTPSPLVKGDTCYALLSNGDAVALRGDNGDLIWRRQLLLDNDAAVLSELKTPMADPVIAGDVLVTAFYQGAIIALSARNGQQLWQRELSLKSAPLVMGGRLFIATADGAVFELDPTTGATLWKRELESGELVGPTLLGNRLLVADDAGEVFALSLDGHVTGTTSLPGRVDRKPVSAPGGALLRNNLGGLYLIR